MEPPQIVLDTNVFIAALRSREGASFPLLQLVGGDQFQINLSVPLVLEYEAAATRILNEIPLTSREVRDIIDYLCQVANPRNIYYLWRPFLKDPNDDMVLELAVAGQCDAIVTFNKRDFLGADRFGLRIMTPQVFLKEIGESS